MDGSGHKCSFFATNQAQCTYARSVGSSIPYGHACSAFVGQIEYCDRATDADLKKFTATEACPVSCGIGCVLTYDSCLDQQDTCQNGGVCTNVPGVVAGAESFTCTCAAGYCGDSCEASNEDPALPPCPVSLLSPLHPRHLSLIRW
jgi:hypothetical protein